MAGRPSTALGRLPPARTFGDRTRQRIDSTMIVERLSGHVKGEHEMSNTQINAARILLNKTLPDLKVLEVQARDDRDIRTIPLNDLMDIIEGDKPKRIK